MAWQNYQGNVGIDGSIQNMLKISIEKVREKALIDEHVDNNPEMNVVNARNNFKNGKFQ